MRLKGRNSRSRLEAWDWKEEILDLVSGVEIGISICPAPSPRTQTGTLWHLFSSKIMQMPEHSEMPISTLETRSRISSFQSHASRRDREFLPFGLMLRDEIENFREQWSSNDINFHNFKNIKFGQDCFLKLLLSLLSKCHFLTGHCVRRVKVKVASKGLVKTLIPSSEIPCKTI